MGGNSKLKQESTKLIKYFLASLTVPEDDLWVNLSPYEKDRIIPEAFGQTEMGRDLLSQDYILKQLTASLLYPENDLGKTFWNRVYKKAQEQYGTSEIPINTFNKVWIVPDKAEVYETEDTAFVTESHLKVMLEEDYVALQMEMSNAESRAQIDEDNGRGITTEKEWKSLIPKDGIRDDFNSRIASQIIREIILPAIEVEVNEGKNFAQLRQIYNSLILAAWFKRALKENIVGAYSNTPFHFYIDQNKITGVDIEDKEAKQKIYNQYLEAFKKGVYDYIKEDYDPATQEIIPRRYFSGGIELGAKVGDFGGGIAGVIKRHPMRRSGQPDRNFFQKIMAAFRGTAMLVRSELNTGDTQGFVQAFDSLENGYRNILREISSQEGSQFYKILKLISQLEKQYEEIDKIIRGFLNKKDLQGTFLAKVLEEYQKEIKAVHQEYRELLTVYVSLIWPNGREDNMFKKFFQETETIWQKWSEGENLQLKELVRLRAKRNEAESLTDQKRLSQQLIQTAHRVLLSQIASGPRSRLQDQFRLSLYTETMLDLIAQSQQEAGLENILKKFTSPPPEVGREGWGEIVEQRISDWIYGYAPDISQDEKDILEKAILKRAGKEVKKIEGQKSFRRWMKTMVTSLGIASLLLPLSEEADVAPENFKEKSAVEATVEGTGNKTEESESAVETPQTPAAPLPLAVLFQSLAASLPEVSEPSSGVSEEASQKKAIEAKIQEIRQQLATLEAQQDQLAEEAQALKESAQNKLDQLMAQTEHLKLSEDLIIKIQGSANKAQGLKEPNEWQKPKSPEGKKPSLLPAPVLPKTLKDQLTELGQSVFGGSQQEADTREKPPAALSTTFGPSRVDLGDGNIVGTGHVFAQVQGGNGYLQIGQYSWVDPIQGRFFNQENHFNVWNLDGEGNFSEYVLMEPQSKKQVLLYVPPGYVVSGLLTEKGVGEAAVYYDTVNGVWMAVFDQAPGSLKIRVRPAQGQELKDFPPMQIVDGQGNILAREKALEVIQQNVPGTLWEILQILRNMPQETQGEIVKEILGLFYYSTNPYFNDSQFRGDTVLATMLKYFAGECQGLSNLRWMIAYVLNQPMLIAGGYLDTDSDGMFTSGVGHQWNIVQDGEGNDRIQESTNDTEATSPLSKKSDVLPEDWRQEMDYLQARAPAERKELERILLGLKGVQIEEGMRSQQKQLTNIANESPNERAQEYYAKAMIGYEQQLGQLRAAPIDRESANTFLTQIEQLNLQNIADRYQLMSYGHYLFEALAIIDVRLNGENPRDAEFFNGDTGHLRIQEIKNNLFVKIAKLAKSKGWALIEPTSFYPIFLRINEYGGRRDVTDFQDEKIMSNSLIFIFDEGANTSSSREEFVSVLADVLTGEYIMPGNFLIDYVPGLQIWYDDILKEVKLRGDRADSEEGLVYRQIRSFHVLGPGQEDWLVYADRDQRETRFFGPMARKLGIEGGTGQVDFKDMNNWVVYGHYKNTQKPYLFGKGELFQYIRRENNFNGVGGLQYFSNGKWVAIVANFDREYVDSPPTDERREPFGESYTGPVAEKEGWIGQKFMEARNPIQTPKGNFIAKVKDELGWRFIGSGLEELGSANIKNLDGKLETQRFEVEPGYPVFFPNGEWLLSYQETDIDPISQERENRFNLYGSEKIENEVKKLGINLSDITKIFPIQTAPNGKWIGQIDLVGSRTVFFGPFAEENGLKGSIFVQTINAKENFPKFVILDNNEFYIILLNNDMSYGFVGTWAKSQGLEGVEKDGTKFRKAFKAPHQPVFAENPDRTKDYSRWVIVDETGTDTIEFYGPLVAELGLPSQVVKKSNEPPVTELANGNVLFRWQDGQGQHMVSLRPFDAHNFLTRTAARYDVTDGDAWGSLPERRIDQRLEYLALRSEELSGVAKNEWGAPLRNIAFRERFLSLIQYMIENFSTHFFDAEQVEAHLRKILLENEDKIPVEKKLKMIEYKFDKGRNLLFPGESLLGTELEAFKEELNERNFLRESGLFSIFGSNVSQDLFRMLRVYGLNSFAMELSLAFLENVPALFTNPMFAEDVERFRSFLTPEEWQDSLESYLERLRENLPGNILVDSQDFATPELVQQVDALNNLVLSLADEETRLSLTEYQEHLTKVRTFLEGTQIPHSKSTEISKEYLEAVFDFIHGTIDDSMPFDAEVSGNLLDHPLYAMAKALHHDPAELKVDANREETANVQSKYEHWQEVNDKLNSIFKSQVGGKDDTSFFPLAIDDIGHDGIALAMLIWALMFPATWMTKAVEKKDWFVRHNGRNSIRKIWERNAFGIRGEGLGDQEGERDILARLMTAGALMTEEQRDQLEELRKSMDDCGKAVIDAIRLIALDSPSQCWQ